MKTAFVSFILFFITTTSYAQSVVLEFESGYPSNLVYIGIENIFFIRGNVNDVISFTCEGAFCKRSHDTLRVMPGTPGPLKILLETKKGIVVYNYEAALLPSPVLLVGDINKQTPGSSKSSVLNIAEFRVASDHASSENLFESYQVHEMKVTIKGESYLSKGKTWSDSVKLAIIPLESGDTIRIDSVVAIHQENKRVLVFQPRVIIKIQ